MRLVDVPDALEPEQIIVLEIAGELSEFVEAVGRIEGLEWLAEVSEEELEPDQEFALVAGEREGGVRTRQLFIVASDTRAWRELIRLWGLYRQGQELDRGLTPFRHLFDQLRDLREWDDRDRLLRAGAAEAWHRDLPDLGDELVPFELELWLRRDVARRQAESQSIADGLAAVRGEVRQELILEEISYHGILGMAPASLLLEAAELREVRWLRTGGVRLFHAAGQCAVPEADDFVVADPVVAEEGPVEQRNARVGLLDGLPVENHELLAGRLIVDDPEGWAAEIPVSQRVHGTAMASLAIHGDLNSPQPPPREPIYLRPIIRVEAPPWVAAPREELPSDRLVVDLIYAAVARMLEGGDAVARTVVVIGLSVADTSQPFDRFVSPWARLLDWLSARYRVLFLVSAGNYYEPVDLPEDVAIDDPAEVQHEILDWIRRNALYRRVLAPAESLNALTIGCAHADHSDELVLAPQVEPYIADDLASVISPVGRGFRRSVKPEILMPGGRQLLRPVARRNGRQTLQVQVTTRPPGLRVASPDPAGLSLGTTTYICGTSGANALALRASTSLLQGLDELRDRWGDDFPSAEFDPVLVKALLVHTGRWGTARAPIASVLAGADEPSGRAAIGRFLGYGRAYPEEALLIPDEGRIAALYAAEIADGEAHSYVLPLPPSLASSTIERRFTFTLAWLTPINPSHRNYRRAALRLDPGGGFDLFGAREDADSYAARRGTVQHETLRGRQAVPFVDGETASFVVSCRADAGELADAVPYGLVVTLEVPLGLELPIYSEVRERLVIRVPVRQPR